MGWIDYKKAYDMIPHITWCCSENYDVTEKFHERLANGTYIIWEESRKCLPQRRLFQASLWSP